MIGPRPWALLAWYLAVLLPALGGVQAARAVHVPGVVDPPVQVVRSQPILVPPKPTGVVPPRQGTGPSTEYSWEGCEQLPARFADVCFSALARQRAPRDPDGGLDACERVLDPALSDECRADVAELYASVDPSRSRRICEQIPRRRWRDQCVFGIATAWALRDPGFAMTTCESSGRWKAFCRHDVNGERATVDPEGAVEVCRGLQPADRPTCWHGIGKYVARVEPDRAVELCRRAPSRGDLLGQCAHGVGWAVAEARAEGAVGFCEPLGELHDGCLMGVAYHTRRYDAQRAVELCRLVRSGSERRHCLEVARRVRVAVP